MARELGAGVDAESSKSLARQWACDWGRLRIVYVATSAFAIAEMGMRLGTGAKCR